MTCITLYSRATKILQYSVIQLIRKNNSSEEAGSTVHVFYKVEQSKDCLMSDYLKMLKLNNIILFTLHLTFCHTEILRRWIQPNVE